MQIKNIGGTEALRCGSARTGANDSETTYSCGASFITRNDETQLDSSRQRENYNFKARIAQENSVDTPRYFRNVLVPTAASLLSVPAAFAADPASAPEVEQVVVTAQKEAYRGDTSLQDLPQSVEVLTADLLKDVGVTRLDDALDLVSGVARQNNFGGLWDAYAIRGFAGNENLPSGFLVNGFNAGRGFGGPRDLSDVDHIEVVKGPASALFGRG